MEHVVLVVVLQELVVVRPDRLHFNLDYLVDVPFMDFYAKLLNYVVNSDLHAFNNDLYPVNSVGDHACGERVFTILDKTNFTMQEHCVGKEDGYSQPLDGAYRMLDYCVYEGMVVPILLSIIGVSYYVELEVVP